MAFLFHKKIILSAVLAAGFAFFAGCGEKKEYPKGAEGIFPPDEATVEELISVYESYEKTNLDTNGLITFEGPEDGHIVIHKFADFNCPLCYEMGKYLQRAVKRWPGRVTVHYRYFPWGNSCNPESEIEHEGSCNSTRVSLCTADKPYFLKVYHGIFDLQAKKEPINLESLEKVVTESGGSWKDVVACLETDKIDERIKRDLADAKKLNIHATPTIIINNRRFPKGLPNEEVFMYTLDALVFERDGMKAFPDL